MAILNNNYSNNYRNLLFADGKTVAIVIDKGEETYASLINGTLIQDFNVEQDAPGITVDVSMRAPRYGEDGSSNIETISGTERQKIVEKVNEALDNDAPKRAEYKELLSRVGDG